MKKTALAAVAVLAVTTGSMSAFAQDAAAPAAAPASAPEASPITYNIGVVSDYRYRGISQTKMKPALQGGIDYANGPIYVGTWASTIQWVKDSMVSYNRAGEAAATEEAPFAPVSEKGAPVEWDLYGGTKGDIIKDTLSYDVGVLAYVYLGQKFHQIGLSNPDTGEVYGALTYGIFTAKVSVSATPLFGVPKSKGSQYYDLSANFDLGSGFTLTPDIAYQNVEGSFARDHGLKTYSYGAYSATLGKDFGSGLSGSLQVIATDAEKSNYVTSNGKFTGRTTVVAGVKYSF
jgi:uncharacterized protein (TIGR02001 family)